MADEAPAIGSDMEARAREFRDRYNQVKAEIGPVDVMAVRDGADPVVVELKAGFSLTLLQQAVARQSVTDTVYVAVPRWAGKSGWRAFKGNVGLCKRLGLGVLSVRLEDGKVQVHADPSEFRPRKSKTRRDRLLSEFARREGDPNTGGVRGQVMTAYKQDCARIAAHLAATGPCKGAEIAKATGVPRPNTYNALESLTKRGAVQPISQNPAKYVASPPDRHLLNLGRQTMALCDSLSKELAKRSTGRTLYILDEPTTGLHFEDVKKLLEVLHELVESGNTVVVIEHNLDVVKTADWIVDIGPEGGDGGGEIVAVGTPEDVAEVERSHTGRYLKDMLAARKVAAE